MSGSGASLGKERLWTDFVGASGGVAGISDRNSAAVFRSRRMSSGDGCVWRYGVVQGDTDGRGREQITAALQQQRISGFRIQLLTQEEIFLELA